MEGTSVACLEDDVRRGSRPGDGLVLLAHYYANTLFLVKPDRVATMTSPFTQFEELLPSQTVQ